MIEDLLTVVSENKQGLLEKIEKLTLEINQKDISQKWTTYQPEEQQDVNIAAVDGSANYLQYKGFVLYALSAKAIGHVNEQLLSEGFFDVDILHPYRKSADRIRLYMSLSEKKIALRFLHAHSPTLLLLDGSILGDLIRPAAYERAPNKKTRSFIEETYLDKIRASLDNGAFNTILSKNFVADILSKTTSRSIDAIIYLEYLENILTINHLLSFDQNIVGISKTSRSINYFRQYRIPDMALFETFCRSPGFSKPLKVQLDNFNRYKRHFPILDQELRDIPLSLFYARFSPKSPVLKFEYVGEPSEAKAKEILDRLAFGAVEGYPYLLRKAHSEVVITNRDVQQIARILGLIEKTGREVLA